MALLFPVIGVNAITYVDREPFARSNAIEYMHTQHPETQGYTVDVSLYTHWHEPGRHYHYVFTYSDDEVEFTWEGRSFIWWYQVDEFEYNYTEKPQPEPEPVEPVRSEVRGKVYYDFSNTVGQWTDYPNEHMIISPPTDKNSPRRYKLLVVIVNSEGLVTMSLTFRMRRGSCLSAYIGGNRFTEGTNRVIAMASELGWVETYFITR